MTTASQQIDEIKRRVARGEGYEDIYVALRKLGMPISKWAIKDYVLRRSSYTRRYGT